jgi:CheY-like chemotaxis protein
MRALVLIDNPAGADQICACCAEKDMETVVTVSVERALKSCSENPPDLVIVADRLSAMSGPAFIARVLKVSWTISSILITDEDEETVHDKCEGLGILGRITSPSDREGLERLLDDFAAMQTSGRSAHG